MRRAFRVVSDLALTVGALVGVACLVAAIGAVAFGVHPLIFRSGSMAPTIPSGSIAFAREVPAADIDVGDVVSVPWHDSRVTHRVVEVFHRPGSATLKLKGDANDAPDADLYQVGSAYRVWFSVPVVGSVVAWLSRAPGVFVLAAYAALLLSIVFRRVGSGGGASSAEERGSPSPPRPGRHVGKRRAARGGRRARVVGVASAATVLGVVTASPTWAAWTDQGTVNGTTIGTYTLPNAAALPTTSNCSASNALLGSTLTLHWTGVTPDPAPRPQLTDYEYELRFLDRNNNNAQLSTVIVAHAGAAGSQQTYQNSASTLGGLLGLNLASQNKVTTQIYVHLKGTLWYSSTPVSINWTVTTLLGIATFTCNA